MNTFKKYPKDWLITIGVLLLGFFAVMGWHFTETATKPFWWTFWVVVAVLCGVVWMGLWIYFKKKDRSQ